MSQVTFHDSAWFLVNADGTEIPIVKEDWEKVHKLVVTSHKMTEAYNQPTSLKLYEIDAEFEVESSNEHSVTKEMRVVRVDLFSPCEKAILNAQYELEKVGSSEGLTEAAILLSKARQLVCDYLINK